MNSISKTNVNKKDSNMWFQVGTAILLASGLLMFAGISFNHLNQSTAVPVKLYNVKIDKSTHNERSGKTSSLATYIYVDGVTTKTNKHIKALMSDNKAPLISKTSSGELSTTIYEGNSGLYYSNK